MQFPQDIFATSNLCISSIKHNGVPDHNLCYCPDWTVPNKPGRPKKDARKKSVLENATGTKKKLKKATGVKRARRYCQSCGRYSHVTNDCWNLPENVHQCPQSAAAIGGGNEAITIDLLDNDIMEGRDGEGGSVD